MTAFYLTQRFFAPVPRTEKAERTIPARPAPGPVLIGDCSTAADHTTLLCALWRRWDDQPPED